MIRRPASTSSAARSQQRPATPRPARPGVARSPQAPSGARRAAGRTASVLAALVALVVLLGLPGGTAGLAAPAAAHDALTGSTPGDGTTVEAPPASVDLVFSRPPLAIGAEVQVTGPDGQVVNGGDLTITDTTVSQPLVDALPAGAYAVAWRVTSADGHPISGSLTFTATAGTEPAATPEPTQEPAPGATTADPPELSPGPDVADPGGDAGADVGTEAGTGADPGGNSGSTSPLPWVLGGAGLLAAVAVVGWVARRRRGAGTGV